MADFAIAIVPAGIALTSAYAATLSRTAILDVLNYEDKAKKAAKWSNIAEDALQETTTSEGAGAVATALSLITSLILLITTFATTTPRPWLAISSSATCCIVAFAASGHIHGVWHGKAKIPLVRKYNESIDKTNALRQTLGWLALAWFAEAWIRGFAVLV